MTALLTTHLLDEAERLCQKIGILKQGQILLEGSLSQLRNLIPAQEVLVMQTTQKKEAIARAQAYGFTHRYYDNELAFWLPESLELKEIISLFEGISIDAISRQPVRLEHIYLEITQQN